MQVMKMKHEIARRQNARRENDGPNIAEHENA